jgi:hypothetical protein
LKKHKNTQHAEPATRDTGFVGREDVLRQLSNGVRKGESQCLLGGPKTGVTSVLKVWCADALAQWHTSSVYNRVLPVYVDVESAPVEKPGLFVAKIWDVVREALLDRHVQGNTPPPVLPRRYTFGKSASHVHTLADYAEQLSASLKGHEGWFRYAVCLDHMDALLKPKTHPLLKEFFEWSASGRLGAPYAWVCTGGRSLHAGVQEGLPTCAPPVLLGALREDDTLAWLKQQQVDWTQEDIAAFVSLTGNHPYLNACLKEMRQSYGAGFSWELLGQKMLVQHEAFFKLLEAEFFVGASFGRRARAAMGRLIASKAEIGLVELERVCEMGGLRDVLDVFEGAGVVIRQRVGDGLAWKTACGLWATWMRIVSIR